MLWESEISIADQVALWTCEKMGRLESLLEKYIVLVIFERYEEWGKIWGKNSRRRVRSFAGRNTETLFFLDGRLVLVYLRGIDFLVSFEADDP